MMFTQEHNEAEQAETKHLVELLTGAAGYYSMVDGSPHSELGHLPPHVEYIPKGATPGKLRTLLTRHIDARRARHGYRVVRRGSMQFLRLLIEDDRESARMATARSAAPYLENVLRATVAPIDEPAVRSALRHGSACLRVAIGGGVPGTRAYHYTRATISPVDRSFTQERPDIDWEGLRPSEVVKKAEEVITLALALAAGVK